MSTGADKSKQSTDNDQKGGGNLIGSAPSAPVRKPATLGTKGFTPDNQSTSRGKGRS